MVNVAGRSKGCSTCRKRRVKCGELHANATQVSTLTSTRDEHRPICRRCQRWGFECTGMRDITFIQATIVKSRRSNNETPKPTKDVVEDISSVEGHISLLAPPDRNLSEICVCYARKYLRRGAPLDLALQGSRLDQIVTTGTSPASGNLFHKAFLSFSILVYGTQHRDKSITERGFATRGAALGQLNHALSDPECYTRNDVILSVIAFAMLDCVVPTGAGQYLKHMIGLQTLLGLRDPLSSCSLTHTGLYKAVRHMILFASLQTAKPSILARSEWKAALRENCSDEEIREQELFDIMADCTVINARLRERPRDGLLGLEESQQDNTRDSAMRLLTQLYDWRKEWDNDGRNSYIELPIPMTVQHPLQSSSTNGSDCLLTTVLKFSDESTAAMFMFYNTALIYIFRVLAGVHAKKFDPRLDGIVPRDNPSVEFQGDTCEYSESTYVFAEKLAAIDIYRTLPHYLNQRSSTCTNTTPVVHWAISTAWNALGRHESAYGKWLKAL